MLTFQDFRAAGYRAIDAHRNARIAARFDELNATFSREIVRIRAEDEDESYFDDFGEPEEYVNEFGKTVSADEHRADIIHQIETYGCLCVISEYLDEDEEWQIAGSIGMCVGYKDACNPLENWYVPDLMQEAITAADALIADIAHGELIDL